MINLSKYNISNMTCLGTTFKGSGRIKLYKLVKVLKIDTRITGIKYAKSFKYVKDVNSKYIYYKYAKFKNPWYNMPPTCKVDEKRVANGFTYTFENGYLIISIMKGNMIKKKKKKKKKKEFKNSITIIIDRSVNCKICTNGKIHITGCKTEDKCIELLHLLNKYFIAISKYDKRRIHIKYYDKFKLGDDVKIVRHVLMSVSNQFKDHKHETLGNIKENYPNYYEDIKTKLYNIRYLGIIKKKMIFYGIINVSFKYIAMIMSHFHISNAIEIDQNKLYEYINYVNRYDMYPTFRNIKKKTLQLDYTDINGVIVTYMIFRSGKINMTNCKSIKQVDRCYNFMKSFINDNIKHFILYDITNRAIDHINCTIKQRSKEWLQLRKKCITASDAYKAIMKNPPFGQTLDKLIIDKVYGSQFKGNDATFFGTLFEPVVQKLLPKLYNNKKFNIYVYDAGFYISDETTFIGASPDGIIIKYKDVFPKNKYAENRDKILDVCLLEIKCPYYTYVPIKESLHDEKPHYYWQIQQQLYVTGFKYCIFIQCHFEHYKNEFEFSRDVSQKFKGVYIYFKKNGKIMYLSPSNYKHIKTIKKTYNCYIKYWKLSNYDITEVDFDEIRFGRKIKKLKNAHDLIINEQKKYVYGEVNNY